MFFKKKKNPEDICRFCRSASTADTPGRMLCKHRGEVSEDFSCRKVEYDFLKRDPGKAVDAPKLEYIDIND